MKIPLLRAGGAVISRSAQNQGFTCEQCGSRVRPLGNGGYRNHCPACLYSKHVDVVPGDRASPCRGLMRPAAIERRRGKGLVVVHRCVDCGFVRANRIADDPEQGDDVDAVIAVLTSAAG